MTFASVTRTGVIVGMLVVGIVDMAGLIQLPGLSCVLLAVLIWMEV